ncbi:hypothetical protein PV08_03525 [Exophiala spinifera]|uniref:Uncharacterized protein n=1 Tax=Exophiala spinifera TaxID=91928 RepID=A0A0D1YVB8_9EURO|nr:uncharacterized protein PV08_03525 [Exophiala spinifera]KIW19231.1 hypothetical protein PV08_03525 [Exophiala spinifera]
MDILTRLIAGSGTSPTKQKTNTPAERLATCKSICNALTQAWRGGAVEREEESALTYTAKLLQRLENILHDESRRAAPHSCLRYVASSQAYIIITKLAVSSRNTEIIKLSAQLFHILINGEAEGLLDSKLFTRSLLDLVCYATIGGQVIVEERLETDLVELLFEIATKIRLDPDILPAWFYPDRENTRGRNGIDETRRSQFPLFFVLVQYVHHDGPVGDFARTALLYLTETASRFKPLETWMIESDLAPQMASGLGALYSRLSRQSTSLAARSSKLAIVTLSDYSETVDSLAESPRDSPQAVKAFFSYLAFWQDTLNHCKSLEVSDTLLDHFQVLFVQQLLYPSLLESSDVEGGSTAAVITHLSRMLLAVDHYQLIDRMLGYLLASPHTPRVSRDKSHRRQRMSVSRSKSIEQLKALSETADSPSPNLFNLLDLLVMSLKSSHSETVNACLKLLSVIIGKHHCHVPLILFRTEVASTQSVRSGVDALNAYLHKLFEYSGAVGKDHLDNELDQSYQDALQDCQVLLEQHSCFVTAPADADLVNGNSMTIAPECKLFEALTQLLRNFFANDSVTNLYLTEALVALTACEYMDLQGWLLPGAQGRLEEHSAYNITFILSELADQATQWKSQFPQWDELMSLRRHELSEDAPEQPANPRTSSGQTAGSTMRTRSISPPKAQSRPATPRGRPIPPTEFGSIDSKLSGSGSHRADLAERALGRSPLRQALPTDGTDGLTAAPEAARPITPSTTSLLRTQVDIYNTKTPTEATASLPVHAGRKQDPEADALPFRPSLTQAHDSGTATPISRDDSEPRHQATLNHILTNAVILQEFILEIAAIVQLRATFFDEISF